MKPSIAVLGTGRMGAALVRALLLAEFPVTAWNRTAARAAPLAELGATIAASPLAAIAAADIVIVNVSDYAASTSLLQAGPVASALRGKRVIDLTSGTPQNARDASDWAASRAIGYLDGAILATPDFIGTDAGTILLAGPRADFDESAAVLRAFGGNVQHIGTEPGLANALDSAVLSLMWGALFGALHAIAISAAEKISLSDLSKQWRATAPVVDGLVHDLIHRVEARRFAADDATLSTVSPHYGAFQHLRALLSAGGIDNTVAEAYQTIFQRAMVAGHEHDDFAVLSQFMTKPG